MDLADAVAKIQDGFKPMEPKVVMVEGKEYVLHPKGGGIYELVKDPRPAPERRATAKTLALATLQGLVDYIEGNIDGLDLSQLLVVVEDPTTVTLVSRLVPSHVERATLLERDIYAKADGVECEFDFGAFQDQERFILGVLLNFADTPERQDLLNLVGNVRGEAVYAAEDDGVAQRVESREGVGFKVPTLIRNPWMLAPYRAFREVEQVTSPIVLRVQKQPGAIPLFALFEADGDTWEIEAIKRVSDWLKAKLGDIIRVLS